MKNFIDQPYIETTAIADTLAVPDRIYISIHLDEPNAKTKTSTESQEQIIEAALSPLGINTKENLSLESFQRSGRSHIMKTQSIVNTKMYLLLVYDAITAGKVLTALEKAGISNIRLEKTEYSQAEDLYLNLKTQAILKAKNTVTKIADLLQQKIGKAIYIEDNNSTETTPDYIEPGTLSRAVSSSLKELPTEHILVELKKLKFKVQLNVKFALE